MLAGQKDKKTTNPPKNDGDASVNYPLCGMGY